jgi:hypothetical protein
MAKISFVTSGGGSPPGGSVGQVQFNDGGVFGGDPGLTYDKLTKELTVSGSITYSPENLLDWDSAPSTLRQAVDYLAAGSGSIAPGAVGSTELATESVQSYHIASGAIGSTQIQAGAVSTTQLSLTVLNVLPSDTQANALSGSSGTPSTTNLFMTQEGGSYTGPVTFNQTASFNNTATFNSITGSAITFYDSSSNSTTFVTNTSYNQPTMIFYSSGSYENPGSGQTVEMSSNSFTFINGPTYTTSSTTNIDATKISFNNTSVATYPTFMDYSSKAESGGEINVSFLTAGGMTFGATNPTGSLSGSLTISAAAAASGGGTTITSSGSQTGLIPLNLSASAINVSGGGMFIPGGVTGDLYGTASYALNADLLDGRDSTTFAGLTSNTFTGIQVFNNVVTGTTGYFSGDLIINGTASIGFLETREQQSLRIGDKYIVILSGAADHTTLDGSGILYGSGGVGPTVDEFGSNASIRYRNMYDALEIFPGLRVTGSMMVTGNAEVTGTLTVLGGVNASGGLSGKYQTFSSNFTVTNAQYFCAVNTTSGAVTASLDLASSFNSGQSITFKDIAGFAGTTGKAIRINASGSDKIDGLSSAIISVASGTMSIVTDGSSNWFISNIF